MGTGNQDTEHLRLLSIFHYILGAFVALGSCIWLIYIGIGAFALTSPSHFTNSHGQPMPALFGWVFIVIGALILLAGWAVAVLMILAGRFISQRRHFVACMVIAGFSCLFAPFGTVLGILTILVLNRPSVKAMFHTQV